MKKLAFAALFVPLFVSAARGDAWGVATFADGDPADLTRVNELGEAVLTDDDLAGKTLTGIKFLGDTPVASIVLTDQIVRFSGNCLLTISELSSAFVLTGGEWTFDGLAFVGNGQVPKNLTPIAHEGGAINVCGGKLTLTDCAFTNCAARFSGGAVNALEMSGDVVVSNCTFVGNQTWAVNGSGGAIYASGATDGRTLRVTDCRFERNGAQNGGAISTRHTTTDAERPMRLEILRGNAFEGNEADYEGGAVFAGGVVSIVGPNVLFEGNSAGDVGGALGLNGVLGHFAPVAVTISNGVTFADNTVSCDDMVGYGWTAGGAIGVMIGGCVLDVDGAIFTNNVAETVRNGQPAFGGAIYTTEGVTNVFRRTAFVDNDATSGKVWCYGGAVSVEGGRTTVDTCVFDYGGKQNAKAYGNAIDFNGTDVSILNSTFRRGKVEAISAYNSPIAMTNCVVVGNGAAGDLYIEGQTVVSMAYCAYGVCQVQYPAMVTGVFNLSGRSDDIYDGASLRLDGSDFNPVAGLGLRQPGVSDFVGTEYGSRPYGFSMGAFETNTSPRVVNAYGTREYDGTTSSNGCLWTNWKLTDTNFQDAAFAELVPTGADVDFALRQAFTVTNWVFGTEANGGAVGHYDSTNATDNAFFLKGGIRPNGVTNEWLCAVLVCRLCGDITAATESAFDVYFSPADFPWNGGNPIEPKDGYVRTFDGRVVQVVITNAYTGQEMNLDDFDFSWDKNRQPTDSAELIATCTNGNFRGTSNTNLFSITAYLTEYRMDGLLDEVTTNGWLAGSNACAAVEDVPGHCVDWQNSVTNGEVRLYGSDGPGSITTFTVLYERDVVGEGANPGTGDGVPDKYQRKFLFMTVNGWWQNEQNGADKVRWVTLTNSTSGKWDTTGVGTLTSATVPKGVDGWNGYADTGFWYNGETKSADIVGTSVSSQSFAFFFYNPNRAEAPGAGRTSPDGETKPDLQSAVKSVLRIADFSFDGDRTVTGSVEADVTDGAGKSLLDSDSNRPLENVRIEILGAASLGDDWSEQFVVDTDADGRFKVDRVRTAKFFKVQLRQCE